ncbi:hypothetical protein WJX74_010636 [Apatococcus lobatus]|uniref:Uncharacterized protein n=1 Tax=Apatococcus lobatus TaxID=904363 RepID=A0AAW1RSP8_9CHLO
MQPVPDFESTRLFQAGNSTGEADQFIDVSQELLVPYETAKKLDAQWAAAAMQARAQLLETPGIDMAFGADAQLPSRLECVKMSRAPGVFGDQMAAAPSHEYVLEQPSVQNMRFCWCSEPPTAAGQLQPSLERQRRPVWEMQVFRLWPEKLQALATLLASKRSGRGRIKLYTTWRYFAGGQEAILNNAIKAILNSSGSRLQSLPAFVRGPRSQGNRSTPSRESQGKAETFGPQTEHQPAAAASAPDSPERDYQTAQQPSPGSAPARAGPAAFLTGLPDVGAVDGGPTKASPIKVRMDLTTQFGELAGGSQKQVTVGGLRRKVEQGAAAPEASEAPGHLVTHGLVQHPSGGHRSLLSPSRSSLAARKTVQPAPVMGIIDAASHARPALVESQGGRPPQLRARGMEESLDDHITIYKAALAAIKIEAVKRLDPQNAALEDLPYWHVEHHIWPPSRMGIMDADEECPASSASEPDAAASPAYRNRDDAIRPRRMRRQAATVPSHATASAPAEHQGRLGARRQSPTTEMVADPQHTVMGGEDGTSCRLRLQILRGMEKSELVEHCRKLQLRVTQLDESLDARWELVERLKSQNAGLKSKLKASQETVQGLKAERLVPRAKAAPIRVKVRLGTKASLKKDRAKATGGGPKGDPDPKAGAELAPHQLHFLEAIAMKAAEAGVDGHENLQALQDEEVHLVCLCCSIQSHHHWLHARNWTVQQPREKEAQRQ